MLIITDENGTIVIALPSPQSQLLQQARQDDDGINSSNNNNNNIHRSHPSHPSSSNRSSPIVSAVISTILHLNPTTTSNIMAKSHHNPSDLDSTNSSSSSSAAAAAVIAGAASDILSTREGGEEGGEDIPETTFEFDSDALLAIAFLVTAIVAAKRMSTSRSQGGAETTVVTAFYSLILLTSTLRTLWFLIPSTVWSPYYTPHATMAFDSTHTNPQWKMTFIEILLQGAGSLSLFSIFILILVYWADILKKYFYPGARRTKPMTTFFALVSILAFIQLINAVCFLLQEYSSEGMILVNSITLSIVSMVCVCEITIFSHRFRTVLKTLGDINQVSTESQVKRIVWITVTGNAFFFTRAFLETIFALLVGVYWHKNGNVAMVFSHKVWDGYILMKHWSELAILGLMLYILQSRFANGGDDSSQPQQQGGGVGGGDRMEPISNAAGGGGGGRNGNNLGYQAVPDADPGVDDDDDGAVDTLQQTLSV